MTSKRLLMRLWKAVENYNIDKATRTGKPNAFAYFTQITWFAFLRRIAKEKKQQEIKLKYLTETGLDQLVYEEINNDPSSRATQAFVDELRERIDVVKDVDKQISDYSKKEKKKKTRHVDSDLTEFMVD